MKAIIIPGNNNTNIKDNWYQAVKRDLQALDLSVIAENMPDADLARKKYWLPFIKKKLSSKDSILIGHSSGAVAILRYLEKNKAGLAILVGACYTDLGDDKEKKSGYYDEPWQWERIRNNTRKIVIFASRDDPYIPITEAFFIKDRLNAEYHEYKDEGHFGSEVNNKIEFPEIVLVVKKFISQSPKL